MPITVSFIPYGMKNNAWWSICMSWLSWDIFKFNYWLRTMHTDWVQTAIIKHQSKIRSTQKWIVMIRMLKLILIIRPPSTNTVDVLWSAETYRILNLHFKIRANIFNSKMIIFCLRFDIKVNAMLKDHIKISCTVCSFWNSELKTWDFICIGLINTSGRKFFKIHQCSWSLLLVLRLMAIWSLPQTSSRPGQKLVGETSAGTIQRLPHHPYTNFLEEDKE